MKAEPKIQEQGDAATDSCMAALADHVRQAQVIAAAEAADITLDDAWHEASDQTGWTA